MTTPKIAKHASTGPAKKSLAEAIAARKAARTPVEPAVLPPQAVIDRKNVMVRDVATIEGFVCELKGLSESVDRMKRSDLDTLAKAINGLGEAIKRVRKGMS
jgi:uncharacterized protein YoxC